MATATADKLPVTMAKVQVSDPMGVGAYGTPLNTSSLNNLFAPTTANQNKPAVANDNPVSAYVNTGVKFTDKDNLWLKEFGLTTINTNDFKRAWAPNKERYRKVAWNESLGGRIAIRSLSRGLLGAAFFAGGQIMMGTEKWGIGGYNDKESFSAQNGPIKFVAKTIDSTSGQIIKAGTRGAIKIYSLLTGKQFSKDKIESWVNSSVTFRPTRMYGGYQSKKAGYQSVYGRSLGDESLAITVDFACASLGDYTGREIADVLDPHIEKTWIKNGHVDMFGVVKALGKSAFTGITRAAGEDFFAMAFGYPYIIRMSRNVINHFSPGFSCDSDNALNGASIKINHLDNNGKPTGKVNITGNYQLEGMTDLAFRFTVYNWYTKIFRDIYDSVANSLGDWWKGDRSLHLPQADSGITLKSASHGTFNWLKEKTRYVLRTIIKMTIIMVPTMPFFFMFRSPQSKDVGLAINPQINPKTGKIYGPIGVFVKKEDGSSQFNPLFADGTYKKKRSEITNSGVTQFSVFQDGTPLFFEPTYNAKRNRTEAQKYEESTFKGFVRDQDGGWTRSYSPYTQYVVWHDYITNPIGNMCYKANKVVTEFLKPIGRSMGIKPSTVANFSRKFTYAGTAYFPYFAAKTDGFTEKYDNPRTEMAIDEALDGFAELNFRKAGRGIGDIGRTILGRPFADPEKEKMAQREMRAFENREPGEGEQNAARAHPIWTPQQKPLSQTKDVKVFASDDLKKKPIVPLATQIPVTSTIKPRDASWQREQLLKQFDDITIPQGHSLN